MERARSSLMRQFVALGIVICLVIGVYFALMLIYMNVTSRRSSAEVMENLHGQMLQRIEEYYKNIENAAYTLCYSPTLQDYILADSNRDRIALSEKLRSVHSGTYLSVESLTGISSFGVDGEYISSSNDGVFFLTDIPAEYRDITGICYTGIFYKENTPNINADSFAMLAPVYALRPGSRLLGERIGTAVFTFNMSHLFSLLYTGTISENYITVLTDRDGNVLSANSPEAALYYQNHDWDRYMPTAEASTVLEKSGWILHSYMPRHMIAGEMRPLLQLTFAMGGVFLVLLTTLIILLRRQILVPIGKLSGFMARVPSDKRPKRFESSSQNELGMMIQVMNRMLDELDEKSRQLHNSEVKILETELSQRQMEILAYRNQINPHFLYNTLDCIRGIALYHDVSEIAEISESLSTMFRYAVKGESFAALEQEVSYIREYALIIGYRFMNRIKIELNVEPEALFCKLPKLSLQPLVENAVFHGLEKQVGRGTISINIGIRGEKLRIEVQDDGVGIVPGKLEALRLSILRAQSPEKPGAENGIGLANIARRLHLFYQSESSITIDSADGQGTIVEIHMPAERA